LDYTPDLLGKFSSWRQNQRLCLLHLWVNILQYSYGKCASFPCSWLRLRDSISFLDDGKNTLLLDLRGLLVAIAEDTPEKVGLQFEILECFDVLKVVCGHVAPLDWFCWCRLLLFWGVNDFFLLYFFGLSFILDYLGSIE